MPTTVAIMHSDACTRLLDLPGALLATILQHVPLPERLGVCTRVCRSFHAAAVVAATNSIGNVSVSTQAQCDDVIEWLQRHGHGVTALAAQIRREFGPCLAKLPCPLLTDLDLHGLSLQPGFFSACTGLTRLRLSYCRMAGSPDATSRAGGNPLMQLSVLRSLHHLGLDAVQAESSEANENGIFLELPSSLLSHLVQVTCLQLGSSQVQSDAALQHISTLSALQHLDLALWGCGWHVPTPAILTGLQHLQHVTALKLRSTKWAVDLRSMPALTALTALRVLSLSACVSVDPAVLAGICQQQELNLVCSDTWDAESSAQLLAAVGQQSQLTLLRLHPSRIWSAPSAAAYSALTASSHLQHLELLNCGLPVSAWQHVFPPTRCLPELCYLSVSSDDDGFRRQDLSPADVQAMVSCCPALASLRLGRELAVPTTAPLGALTGLKRLHASFQDNAPSLAELTGLQLLVLNSTRPGEQVTVSGLLQLTVLRLLQHVAVMGCAYDPGLATSGEAHEPWLNIENKAPAGAPPDVWLQLKELCEKARVRSDH